MKVTIISLNSQYIHSSLAVWYLLSGAEKYCEGGIVVSVAEGTVNEDIEVLYKRFSALKSDVIAFSVYIWNVNTVLALSKMLSKNGVKIVVGGPEVSYCPEKILEENKWIDFVLSGEGEKPFCSLLNALFKNSDFDGVEGLSYRNCKRYIIGQPYITDSIPESPYSEKYFSALNGRIAYIETSRGCPFSCAFCLSGRCGGVRYFPLERAKSDIIALANSGSKIIKFVDRTFNANEKRAYDIFSFIIENYGVSIPKDVCFHFEIAGDLLKSRDFELLKIAPKGAIQFEIGMQSFNGETLKAVNRRTNVTRLKENIKRLTELSNIHIHIDLIAGLPKEDYKSFRESFNTAFFLNADMLQLGFLKLLHGADMREKSSEYPCEFSSLPPYEVTSTPWLNETELNMLHCCENALERFVNSGRFIRTNELIFGKQKRNPFDTLTELGMFTGSSSCPLNEYVDKLFWFFGRGSDFDALRDALICDVAESVKSNVLPKSLLVNDKRLCDFRRFLESDTKTRRKKGVMRNVFLLYGENCGAYVDYDQKIDGKYQLHKIEFNLK